MKNYIQEGIKLELTAPAGGVVSGQGYIINGLMAVASHDAAAAEKFTGRIEGVVEMTKETTAVFLEGEKVYWDDTAKEMDEKAAGRYLAGFATEAAGGGALLCNVKLIGSTQDVEV